MHGSWKKRASFFLMGAVFGMGAAVLKGSDCALQNIFFPLGNGFSWSYRCTAVDDEGIRTFASRVVCTMTGTGAESAIGRLVEVWSGLEAAVTVTTPVKLVGGAVHTVEPTMHVSAPQIGMEGTMADKAQVFQLYLPAMSQLAVGTGWSRAGGFIITVRTPKGGASGEGTHQEADTAQVLGLESVSVGASVFTALKVQTLYTAQFEGYAGPPQPHHLWFAPGVGLVKEIALDGSFVRELTAFEVTPCCGFVVTAAGGGVRVNGQSAAPGMGVSGQAQVSVPEGASLDLSAGDGSRVRVGGGTEAGLEVYCSKQTQGPEKSIIRIVRGLLLTTVSKIFSGHHHFEVHTPSCIIGVRGTEFSVEVRETAGRSRTSVEVMDGEVWVRQTGGGGEIVLRAGSKQTFQ